MTRIIFKDMMQKMFQEVLVGAFDDDIIIVLTTILVTGGSQLLVLCIQPYGMLDGVSTLV